MKRNLTDSILRTTKVGGHIEQVLGPTVERWSALNQRGQRIYREQVFRRYQGLNWPGRTTEKGLRTVSLPRTRGHTEDKP